MNTTNEKPARQAKPDSCCSHDPREATAQAKEKDCATPRAKQPVPEGDVASKHDDAGCCCRK